MKEVISLRNGGESYAINQGWVMLNSVSDEEVKTLCEAVNAMWCAEMADNYHQTLREQEAIEQEIKGLLTKYNLGIDYSSVYTKGGD